MKSQFVVSNSYTIGPYRRCSTSDITVAAIVTPCPTSAHHNMQPSACESIRSQRIKPNFLEEARLIAAQKNCDFLLDAEVVNLSSHGGGNHMTVTREGQVTCCADGLCLVDNVTREAV
jgi:hypothetical protein